MAFEVLLHMRILVNRIEDIVQVIFLYLLSHFENVNMFLIYPKPSNYSEVICAKLYYQRMECQQHPRKNGRTRNKTQTRKSDIRSYCNRV